MCVSMETGEGCPLVTYTRIYCNSSSDEHVYKI